MTKKVTISVPDELFEKMQKWKDSFNFSGIFQKAIFEAIEKKEDFHKKLKEDHSMREVIQRLRKEKMENDSFWFDFGKDQGMHWLESSHYDDIQIVVNTVGSEIPKQELIRHNEQQEAYFKDSIPEILGLLCEGGDVKFPDYDSREYGLFEAGWMEGAKETWEEIKDQI